MKHSTQCRQTAFLGNERKLTMGSAKIHNKRQKFQLRHEGVTSCCPGHTFSHASRKLINVPSRRMENEMKKHSTQRKTYTHCNFVSQPYQISRK